MDSLTFLERAARSQPQPLYVVHGDEDFLKRLVLKAIRDLVFGPEAEDADTSTYAGDKATLAAVLDDLQTLPFFSPRRLVVVDDADPLVTRYRAALEKRVGQLPATATLVLNVKSWPSNTRLYKLVENGAIGCKAPAAYKLPQWCVQWAQSCHGKQLALAAANLLVELVGPEMGLLDQELLKLALYVGAKPRIDSADVDKLVGSSRAEETWKIFTAIAQGQPREALGILDRLLEQGEDPLRLLGAFSWQLRRLVQAARRSEQGQPLNLALQEVGIKNVPAGEQQLRHLGRRTDRLYDWLLEVDFGLKGGSPMPPRLLLERFVLRLARPQKG
jgi:DNA polymerase-3 subunit delta